MCTLVPNRENQYTEEILFLQRVTFPLGKTLYLYGPLFTNAIKYVKGSPLRSRIDISPCMTMMLLTRSFQPPIGI